jgi:hypothetical protein
MVVKIIKNWKSLGYYYKYTMQDIIYIYVCMYVCIFYFIFYIIEISEK